MVLEFFDGVDLVFVYVGVFVVELFEFVEVGIFVIGRGVYGLDFMFVVEGDYGRVGIICEGVEVYGEEEGG